jgi:hypothetical protein
VYIPKFQAVYDQLPYKLQMALCEYNRISIEHWEGGPSAWSWFAFRAEPIEKNLSFDDWASWKDQLNFGSPNDNKYVLREDLPRVHSNLPAEIRGLYFLILHEFGHALNVAGDGWKIWNDLEKLPQNNFPHKKDLCSYWCKSNLIPYEHIPSIYRDLMEKSDYLSLYGAGQGVEEDVPDTFAYWMMNEQHPDTEYWLELPNGDHYEVMQKLRSDGFKTKRDIVKTWYEQTKWDGREPVMRLKMP